MALTDKLTEIGNAIRSKTGRNDPLTINDMISEISSLEIGSSGFPNKMEWIIDTSWQPTSLINFFDNKFVFNGGSTTASNSPIMISLDGISWKTIYTGIPKMNSGLYYADGVWLGSDRDNKLYYATNDLSNWTYSGTTLNGSVSKWQKVNGMYYASSSSPGTTYYSSDGKQWSTLPNDAELYNIKYCNGIWMSLGLGSAVNAWKSTDGINWSIIESIPSGMATSLNYIDGTWFVCLGYKWYYSTDNASSWNEYSNFPESCYYVFHFNNKLITYNSSGYFYSYDAINWTFIDGIPRAPFGFNDLMFWVSESDGTFYYSVDLINWKNVNINSTYKVIKDVVTNGRIFVARACNSDYVYRYAYCPIF